MAEQWVPATEPFRVLYLLNAPHLRQGWKWSAARTYATFAEAVAEINKPFGAGVRSGHIDFAHNATEWLTRGRWVPLAERKRKGATTYRKGVNQLTGEFR